MLTIKDIRQQLGVNEETVRRWVRSGDLEAKQVGRTYQVEEKAFQKFLQTRDGVIGTLGPVAAGSSKVTRAYSIGSFYRDGIQSAMSKKENTELEDGNPIDGSREIENLEREKRKLEIELKLIEVEERIQKLKIGVE